MAFLNQQERDQLLEELKDMKFNRIKAKLRRMDPQIQLKYFRNMQRTGRWDTRYDLVSLGTRVTLSEERAEEATRGPFQKAQFDLVEIIVEPMPENRT